MTENFSLEDWLLVTIACGLLLLAALVTTMIYRYGALKAAFIVFLALIVISIGVTIFMSNASELPLCQLFPHSC